MDRDPAVEFYAENCGTPFHLSVLNFVCGYLQISAIEHHQTNFSVVQRNKPFEVNSILQLLTMHAGELTPEQDWVTWFTEEEEKKENKGKAQSPLMRTQASQAWLLPYH